MPGLPAERFYSDWNRSTFDAEGDLTRCADVTCRDGMKMSGWFLTLVAQKMDFCPISLGFVSGFVPAGPNPLADSLSIMAPLSLS